MTNTTRMRMTKEAAALIHDWRDTAFMDNNSEAINQVFEKVQELSDENQYMLAMGSRECNELKSRCEELRKQRDANARALSDSQKMMHEKDSELTSVKGRLIIESSIKSLAIERANNQIDISASLEIDNAKLKRQLKNRCEWLALFVVSNVVGWGLAITLLAG